MTETDGRRRKGARRRRLLIDAAMRVIERSGVAAVSQRVIATEAEVPASAVTYYFPTVDDLLVAALTEVNAGYIACLQSCSGHADPLAALAELIASSTTTHGGRIAAEYELFLLAARRPALQVEYARWCTALDGFLARFIDTSTRLAAASAAIDGLFLRCCCTPHRSRSMTCTRSWSI